MTEFKKFISNILLAGAAAALIAFVVSLFFTRYWQVSGKIVVFPSGKPISASQNLSEEVGNTAWIVNSDTFQKRNFGDFGANFIGAEVVKNSSMILVKFRSPESDIQPIEDLIVKIPGQVDEYARDLYDGSPFKYKMSADPEISARPIRPNIIENVSWGFALGAALFFLYWIFVESFVGGKRAVEKEEEIFSAPAVIPFEPEPVEPISYEPPTELELMPEPMPEIAPEVEIQEKKPVSKISSVPDNLPIAETSSASEYHEPSDEEVKDRLNKLMRGEL
ncbi:MAG: hypothetical protein A3J76_00065 [Candidatus Moranbacteria bacterium RBG_13_45_13]|nr:MAG: hypothetical protein A3J76_00065 [Candidatus Moranbacteria bacterium RBG_13_45_13]